MPPRSKQNQRQPEWSLCERCKCYISTRDVDDHADICKDDEPFNALRCSLQQCKHCFISNRSVVARLDVEKAQKEEQRCKTPQKDEPQMPLLSKKMGNHIYMHPSTMTMCGLTFMCPALIDHQHVLIAVPDSRLSIASVCVSEWTAVNVLDKKPGHLVVACTLNSVDLAVMEVRVILSSDKSRKADEGFLLHCSHQCVGTFVAVGSHIKVNYRGSVCALEVVQLVIENGEVFGPADEVSISDRLSSIHISPAQDTHSLSSRFFRCVDGTRVTLYEPLPAASVNSRADVSLDDVAGLDKQKEFLTCLVSSMLDVQRADRVKQSGILLPRAVLIYGPSGTGKTMLVKALAHSMKLYLVTVGGSAILSPYVGESEQQLRQLFAEARRNAPSLVLLDEIDAVCPRQRSSHNDVEQRVVSCMCSQLDAALSEDCCVFIVALTRNRDNVNSAIKTSSRISIELEIPVPIAAQRCSILECRLKAMKHDVSSADIADVSSRAHGFVGADLAAVCFEAKQHCLSRQDMEPVVTVQDLCHGLKVVQPSAMKELAIEKPNVHWSDIGGVQELKLKLEQSIVWPIRHPEVFARLGCRPPRGYLLYGPPGCSKTMIAKALATESDLNFIAVKVVVNDAWQEAFGSIVMWDIEAWPRNCSGPELLSKWVGESEKAVRELFRKARAAAPAIIFFDEVDALAVQRGRHGGGAGDVVDRVMAQLLTEIDGVVELKDISILAATNRPDLIDKALKRPGRLDREIYVGLPNDVARREIFEILFRKTPVADDVDINWLVCNTQRYSGAEVAAVVHEAAMCSLSEGIHSGSISTLVHARHFDVALVFVKPRITDEQLKFYSDYASERSKHL